MEKRILISIGTLGLGGAEKQAVWLANSLSVENEVTLLTFSSGEREKDISPKVNRVNMHMDLKDPQMNVDKSSFFKSELIYFMKIIFFKNLTKKDLKDKQINVKNFSSIRSQMNYLMKRILFKILSLMRVLSLLHFVKLFIKIHREITQKRPNVVITFLLHDTIIVGLASIFRFRKPVLIIGRRSPNGYGHSIKGSLQKFIFRQIISRAKVCVSNSNANIPNALIDGVSLGKIVNIPNFIDRSNSIKPKPDEHVRLRIVCVANMHWYKNHANLLKAYSRISDVNEYFDLTLIGKGPLLDENIRLAKKLGLSVDFLTSEENPRELLKNYDAFILVSNFEGSSNAVCEALAEGLPVISSKTGNAQELKDIGAPIILCDSESIDSIESALFELHRNYKVLNKEAHAFSATIQDLYSEEKVFSKWDSLIKSLLDS